MIRPNPIEDPMSDAVAVEPLERTASVHVRGALTRALPGKGQMTAGENTLYGHRSLGLIE
jgi:hypothetical protein